MEIKVEHDFLKFEALTGLSKAGPVYKIPLIFSPGGYSWEFVVAVCRPALQIPTLFQTDAYEANLRGCPPPPGDLLCQKINTIKIRIRIQKTRTTKTGTLRS